ncbi:MAG TPA: two-component sensor histidine kinase, partial [Streptomyces sp.]|nr:two-component sensor histidine kinase [Streptomyces sp.]
NSPDGDGAVFLLRLPRDAGRLAGDPADEDTDTDTDRSRDVGRPGERGRGANGKDGAT